MRNISKQFMTALALFVISLMLVQSNAAPANFHESKLLLKKHVYFDQNKAGALGTLYCGCDWKWQGRSGGEVDLSSCGYEVRKQPTRAKRIEIEHIVAASSLGQQRQCWQDGGRKNCNATDPVFNAMEANLHNLSPVIGEVNGDRSNYNHGMVANKQPMYGKCPSSTDFKNRVFEPRDEAKGLVARVHFYMADRYNLRLSTQQQRVLMAWDKQFPVTAWERERNSRIAKIQGHNNPFVIGEKQWALGFKTSGEGVSNVPSEQTLPAKHSEKAAVDGPVIGNKNSRIYHPVKGCSANNRLPAEKNRIYFKNESEAIAKGFRKSKNC